MPGKRNRQFTNVENTHVCVCAVEVHITLTVLMFVIGYGHVVWIHSA